MMWALALVPFLVVGLAFRYRASYTGYVPLPDDDNPDDPDDPDDLELAVCDVVEWLVDARDRVGLVGTPRVVRVDMGNGQSATRVVFELKQGDRELWLDGPAWMEPLPRVRALDWDVGDAGVPFARNADGLERAVLETNVRRK